MKTGLRIVLRSWQLPWQEKQLLVMPVLLFVAIYASEHLANTLGLALAPVPEPPVSIGKAILVTLYSASTRTIIYTLLGALSVAIALHTMSDEKVDLTQVLSDLRLRAGSLLALALLLGTLITLIPVLKPQINSLPLPSPWYLVNLLSQLAVFLLKTLFLLTLPTIVNEKGRFLHLLRSSWRYSGAILRTLLTSLAGLLLTLALLGFLAILVDNLILIWLDDITSEVVFDGFLARNYRLLLVLPVVWSYQALLYQHARGRESAT